MSDGKLKILARAFLGERHWEIERRDEREKFKNLK